MRSLLLTALLLALPGCVVHEPTHQIIYTPEKPSTNGPAADAPARPSGFESQAALALTPSAGVAGVAADR